MKTLLVQIFAISMVLVSTVSAQLKDVEFSVTRQKLDEQKEREGGNTTIVTKEVRYKVTAQNRTFKTIPELEVKYMVFYEVPVPGTKDEVNEDFHKGSEKITNLEGHRSAVFETKPFKLSSSQLDGNWYYASGANSKAKDRVTGVWIKAFVDDKLVGEYVNPSTISRKNDWKE